MNFVLVNGRTPCRSSFCALCGDPIKNAYLRELGTHLYYCDHGCYAAHCKRVMELAHHKQAALGALTPKGIRKTSKAEMALTT